MNITEIMDSIDDLARIVSFARAFLETEKRSKDVLEYLNRHKVGRLGDNIWHALLDDADGCRQEIQRLNLIIAEYKRHNQASLPDR